MNQSVAENSFWGPPFSNPGAANMNKQHHMNAYLFVFSVTPISNFTVSFSFVPFLQKDDIVIFTALLSMAM